MKENNGQAARRQLIKKLGMVLFVFGCLMGCLVLMDYKYTDDVDDRHHHLLPSPHHGGGAGRQRESLFNKLRRGARRTNPFGHHGRNNRVLANNKKEYEKILSADLTLINIGVDDPRGLRRAPADSYEGIVATFCMINWTVHKQDPSAVPMFRDVQAASHHCDDTSINVPLKDIVALARDMDEENERKSSDTQVPKPLDFTGIVFHESRCGSTLVANTLIAVDPPRHRVYSESPPPIAALKMCGDDYERCGMDQAAAILQDVLYIMGRTNDPLEERVFFKIQSVGTRHIDLFRRAFPTTTWLFVYREPVQVMMSHLALGTRRANCLRSLHSPPAVTQQLVKRHGYSGGTSQLTPEEFCAAHLATITETALQNLKESQGYGNAINYDTLPNVMFETVLPNKMGLTIGQEEIDRIIKVAGQYSKGRGNRKKEWKDDSERKEEGASRAVRKAAKHFMMESYDALQELAVGDGGDVHLDEEAE